MFILLRRLVWFLPISCLGTLFALAQRPELPSGWRKPSQAEAQAEWRNKDSQRYLMATGDFNGDGLVDTARLLIDKRNGGLGLFVCLSGEQSPGLMLVDRLPRGSVRFMGISRVLPGQYRTGCGKGYWDCKEGEPEQLDIKNDSIDYFKVESTNSFFYWDSSARSFKRVWMSD